jgi:NADPH:quinone reductase-like Zn-dependent oxidoreductase
MVESLGAAKLIDYTREDFTQRSDKYDVIYDAVGKIKFTKRNRSLTKSGIYLSALAVSGNIKLKVVDLIFLKELCESGKLKTVIDKIYPFEKIVEAHRYVDKGHKKGNVAITIEQK